MTWNVKSKDATPIPDRDPEHMTPNSTEHEHEARTRISNRITAILKDKRGTIADTVTRLGTLFKTSA
jgi:hypothetical protein